MRSRTFFALMGLALILGTLGPSAAASNKAEETKTPESTSNPAEGQTPRPKSEDSETPGEPPAAEADSPEQTAGADEAPPEAPAGQAENEETGRPELPAIDEEAELETVRDEQPLDETYEVSEATLALLRELETRHASVTAVRGEFDQLKVSEIFLEEIRSEGTFWFKKPDLFRCDYEPPDEMTNLIREDAIYVYVPELEQCEVYRFASDQERDQQLHSMVLGFGFKTVELVEAYEIESSEDAGPLREELAESGESVEETALLELTPRPALADTSPFTRLKLWIDKERLLPEKVWFEDYNGDQTTLEIRTIELNAPVDPKLFVPSFPRGTEYIDKTES